MDIVGDANTARFGDPFETHCNIHPITKDIIVFDNTKFDPLDVRYINIGWAMSR